MTEKADSPRKAQLAEKRAEALRANLKRRKAQAQAQTTARDSGEDAQQDKKDPA